MRINDYKNDSTVELTDRLFGTDSTTGGTRNFLVSDILTKILSITNGSSADTLGKVLKTGTLLTDGFTVFMGAGWVWDIFGNLYTNEDTSFNLDPLQKSTNIRYDLVVLGESNVPRIIKGVEGKNPLYPTITPKQVIVSSIRVSSEGVTSINNENSKLSFTGFYDLEKNLPNLSNSQNADGEIKSIVGNGNYGGVDYRDGDLIYFFKGSWKPFALNNQTFNYYTKSEVDSVVEGINEVLDTKLEANNAIVAGTSSKVSFDEKGLIVSYEDIDITDIEGLREELGLKADLGTDGKILLSQMPPQEVPSLSDVITKNGVVTRTGSSGAVTKINLFTDDRIPVNLNTQTADGLKSFRAEFYSDGYTRIGNIFKNDGEETFSYIKFYDGELSLISSYYNGLINSTKLSFERPTRSGTATILVPAYDDRGTHILATRTDLTLYETTASVDAKIEGLVDNDNSLFWRIGRSKADHFHLIKMSTEQVRYLVESNGIDNELILESTIIKGHSHRVKFTYDIYNNVITPTFIFDNEEDTHTVVPVSNIDESYIRYALAFPPESESNKSGSIQFDPTGALYPSVNAVFGALNEKADRVGTFLRDNANTAFEALMLSSSGNIPERFLAHLIKPDPNLHTVLLKGGTYTASKAGVGEVNFNMGDPDMPFYSYLVSSDQKDVSEFTLKYNYNKFSSINKDDNAGTSLESRIQQTNGTIIISSEAINNNTGTRGYTGLIFEEVKNSSTFIQIPSYEEGGVHTIATTKDTEVSAKKVLNIVPQNSAHTVSLGDQDSKMLVMDSENAIPIYIIDEGNSPNNNLPIGSQISFMQKGTGELLFILDSNVILRSPDGATRTRTQYSSATLVKIGANEWLLKGDVK